MKTLAVKVPGSLLLTRELAKSAKLLWMILQFHAVSGTTPVSQRRLAARYHLARNTIASALNRLRQAGWLARQEPAGWVPLVSGEATRSYPTVTIPVELLRDGRVGMQAKVLYGSLQLTPGYGNSTGRCSYRELSRLTGVSLPTVRRAVRELVATGWLEVRQKNQLSPLHFTLANPEGQRWEREINAVKRRLDRAPYRGETVMREYLSLLVDSQEYDDNASPGFLVNPFTGEEMYYDRYYHYPQQVAFEFNGPQHYGPTAKYPDEESARKQQARDYLKRGISESRGIKLVVLHPEDLTLANIRRKIAGLLPLRHLEGYEPLITFLESASRDYRRKAAHWPRSRDRGRSA